MFRAALRYFSDSERNEVDRCDISGGTSEASDVIRVCKRGEKQRKVTSGVADVLTVKRVPAPKELLHILGHNTRHILQVVV